MRNLVPRYGFSSGTGWLSPVFWTVTDIASGASVALALDSGA